MEQFKTLKLNTKFDDGIQTAYDTAAKVLQKVTSCRIREF